MIIYLGSTAVYEDEVRELCRELEYRYVLVSFVDRSLLERKFAIKPTTKEQKNERRKLD